MQKRMMIAAAVIWATAVLARAGDAPGDALKIIAGPLFAVVEPNTLRVWVQTSEPAEIQCSITSVGQTNRTGESEDGSRGSVRFATHGDSHATGAAAHRIQPGGEYDVVLREAGAGDRPILARGRVKAPPKQGQSGEYTIAFGSCVHTKRYPTQSIWNVVAAVKPDCFLFIGDNVYLPNGRRSFPKTRPEVEALYRKYYDRQCRVAELQPVLRSTISYAIWDDHDYGTNNSDRTWKWNDVALQVLGEYFPNRYGLPDARGCFFRFSWGDLDFFMLDDRSFRDPNTDPNRTTFLGAKQLAWLKQGLAASDATFKIIACGNQMLSATGDQEGWGVDFPAERDAFLDWIWSEPIDGVLFLAGDRHFAELVVKRDPKVRGNDLWELTSSPLANFHHPLAHRVPNQDRRAIYNGGVNVGVLRFDTTAKPPRVEMRVLDVNGDEVIGRTVRRVDG
ncbi:MAG: alkaline phosphatase D family protein [Planctomycetota bacterium]|nr:alkaline phosphatase D family protein [Planctomycetota bacterium]